MRLSVFIKFVCFVAFAHQTLSQVTPITVTTNSGDVRGERTPFVHSDYPEVDTTVDIFKGIPYAKPPVGDLRFAKPEPLDPWQGEYDATYHRPICWQIVENNITTSAQSEDCLHLNIYSPDVHIEGSSYPVFIRIHGGGFIQGSGNDASYDGRPIVSLSDVVFVSMNYRLGAFGFLATGDPEMLGNYGLWDQNLALQWIQENIAHLGGDPYNITIMGQSAGGASVGFHLIATQSWDYFHRGVMSSGNMMSPFGLELDAEKARNDAFLVGRLAGCEDATDGKQLRDCLRQVDEGRLIAAANAALLTTTNVIPLVPVVDGEFITDDPRYLLQQKKFKMCDVMVGNTKDDGSLVAMRAYVDQILRIDPYSDYETFLDRVRRFTYTCTNDIIVNSIAQQYVDWKDFDDPATNYFYKYIELITDETFHCPSEHVARVYAISGMNVYRYLYTWRKPGTVSIPTWYGVGHGYDMPYVFNSDMNPSSNRTFNNKEMEFSVQMMKYYTNFAKTGNANLGSEFAPTFLWEPFTVPGLNILDQTPDFQAIPGDRAEYNAFWNDYLLQLVTFSGEMSEVEKQWREEFNRWKNDDLAAWREDFQEYQDGRDCAV